jgi:hypothetical protein
MYSESSRATRIRASWIRCWSYAFVIYVAVVGLWQWWSSIMFDYISFSYDIIIHVVVHRYRVLMQTQCKHFHRTWGPFHANPRPRHFMRIALRLPIHVHRYRRHTPTHPVHPEWWYAKLTELTRVKLKPHVHPANVHPNAIYGVLKFARGD